MTTSDTYFAAARSWSEDRRRSTNLQTRIAWIVAGVAAFIALLLAVALAAMMPLKSVQPYVVTVDRQTGAVQVAQGLSPGKLTQNDAVIQAQLANYVRARETFDATDLPFQYRRVQLLSAPDVARVYVASMAAANPASPLRVLGKGDTLAVAIKSVSIVAPGVALVRYDIIRSVAGSGASARRGYVSALSFGFSGKPLRLEDRFDNPLGFQVTRYRRDLEGAGS
jgi:type IV secretion system protein VirB8